MTRNNSDFQVGKNNSQEYSINYEGNDRKPGEYGFHKITATHIPTGEKIGKLIWNDQHSPTPGKVESVYVEKEHQRKGVATAMWNYALRLNRGRRVNRPRHSYVKSSEGAAWAKSVGN